MSTSIELGWVGFSRHDLYVHEHSLDDNPLAFTKMAQFTKSLMLRQKKRRRRKKSLQWSQFQSRPFFGGEGRRVGKKHSLHWETSCCNIFHLAEIERASGQFSGQSSRKRYSFSNSAGDGLIFEDELWLKKTGASVVEVFDVKKTSKWSFGNVWGNPLGSCLGCPIVGSIVSPLSNQRKVAKPQIGAKKKGKKYVKVFNQKFQTEISLWLINNSGSNHPKKLLNAHLCVRSWLFSVSPSPWPSAAWCPNLWGAVHLYFSGRRNLDWLTLCQNFHAPLPRTFWWSSWF